MICSMIYELDNFQLSHTQNQVRLIHDIYITRWGVGGGGKMEGQANERGMMKEE